MWGRIVGLVAGLALLAEGYVLWRPEAVGVLASPDLGPYSQYRMVIALLAASVGLMVVIASLLRESNKPKPKPVDFTAPAAPPPTHDAPAAAVETPAHHEPEPVAPVAAPAPPAAHDEHPSLDPFPGHAEPEPPHPDDQPPPPPPPPPPPAPVVPPQSGDRGAYLAAMDHGDQLRAAGRLSDAIDPYSEALRIARTRLAASPQDPSAIRDLACALTSVADVHDRDGRLDSALDLHGESLVIRRTLADWDPNDLAAQRALSTGLERLADTREARGHRSRARDLFRERLPLAERLAAAAPGDSALANDVAVTRERLAELDGELAP